jgi:hypothetical protein
MLSNCQPLSLLLGHQLYSCQGQYLLKHPDLIGLKKWLDWKYLLGGFLAEWQNKAARPAKFLAAFAC